MRKRIYFIGSSGSGKTTLAAHVEKRWGIKRLPSAARTVFAEFQATRGVKTFAELMADQDVYEVYQHAVFSQQLKQEREATGDYVSDRAFDNVVFSSMYGRVAWQLARRPEFQEYLDGLRHHDDGPALIFLVRPSKAAFKAAKADGDRKEYIVWEDVHRFDGAMQYILESNEMSYVSIGDSTVNDRVRMVDALLKMLPKR